MACWDVKSTYWVVRPSQLDPEVKMLFPIALLRRRGFRTVWSFDLAPMHAVAYGQK
jgi:hypothetical protein